MINADGTSMDLHPDEGFHDGVAASSTRAGYERDQGNRNSFVSEESDSDNASSIVFEELEMSNDVHKSSRNNDSDIKDFNDDATFQTILSNYKGEFRNGRRMCILTSLVGASVWLILLIVYANIDVKNVSSNFKWQTDIQLGGENVTLNPYSPENKNFTFDSTRSLHAQFQHIEWLNQDQCPDKDTGYYLTRGSKGSFIIKKHSSKEQHVLIENIQFTFNSNFFYINEIILNPAKPFDDVNAYHIVITNVLPQWRHLKFSLYWLFKPVTNEFIPIQKEAVQLDNFKPSNLTKLHFALFSPDGEKILFAVDHDLFIQDIKSLEISPITDSGSSSLFNGKPDWVYEEEILSADKMVWWSPDSKTIVYGSLNETDVFKYEIDYFVKDGSDIGMSNHFDESDSTINEVNQYPIKKLFYYPKPGTKIPKLEMYKYSVEDKKLKLLKFDKKFHDYILYDATWINNDNFLLKITDRTSSQQSKQVLTVSSDEHKEIEFVDAAKEFGGWIDKLSPITLVKDGYIDKITVHNRTHMAYYEHPLSRTPKLLTSSSDWDILDLAPVVYNSNEKLVYTLSNINGSMDSHLIAVDLNCHIQFVLGGDKGGKYEFSGDSKGHFLTLEYLGPELPWQKVISTGDLHVHDNMNDYLATLPMKSNFQTFKAEAQKYNLPTKLYKTVKHKGVEINVAEILPPNFDPKRTRKYPILVNAYGGPGSQSVTKTFGLGFEESISASLDAIVLQIDPRGTDGKGWKYKSYGYENIGHWEGRDIITITSEYIKKNKKIINQEAVAIWGWSYGGFTTLKTLELDEGKTFKFGMAVAPVTNFLFYNAFYTERYMNLPKDNDKYTTDSLVKSIDSFKSITRLLMMHGTADDNVHLQNLLWLLDKFNVNNIENYDVHFFPDNDHSIHYNNADTIVFDKLTHWLQDAFLGKFKDFL